MSRARVARFRVPLRFDGATQATVTIDRDSSILTIRLLRRRSTLAVSLGVVVEHLLWRDAKRQAEERRQARRLRRAVAR